MKRADLFDLVRTQVVLASGAGPLAGAATQKICASIDEYMDEVQASRTPTGMVSHDSVVRLIEGLRGDLG